MTARREARRVQLATTGAGVGAPPELADRDHPVWRDQRAYRRYMDGHGWSMSPSERMGVPSSPANRRSAAAAAWAVTAGACTRTYGDGKHPSADWGALRAAGLID